MITNNYEINLHCSNTLTHEDLTSRSCNSRRQRPSSRFIGRTICRHLAGTSIDPTTVDINLLQSAHLLVAESHYFLITMLLPIGHPPSGIVVLPIGLTSPQKYTLESSTARYVCEYPLPDSTYKKNVIFLTRHVESLRYCVAHHRHLTRSRCSNVIAPRSDRNLETWRAVELERVGLNGRMRDDVHVHRRVSLYPSA